jgi:Na+/proline symporter
MNYLSVDYLIVYAFLLITLIIGLRAGRGIKDMQEYVLANRQFGTVALTLTYLATNIAGASVFNVTALIVDDGAIITAALLALVLTFLFRAIFIAPQAAKFTQCITMGDLVGTFYGPTSKIIAGCLGVFTTFCIATMELSMLGEVGHSLFGWPRVWTIILGGVGSALYAAHGGIKSVTATDVFQFLVLLIGIPVLAVLALEEAGGMHQVIMQVPPKKLQILNHPEFARYLAMALIWILPLGMIDPAEIQRLLMGRSKQALRTQYLLVAGFDPSLQLTLLMIGLAGMVLYPQIEGLQLVPHMVHNLLPIGVRGLLMAGLLGVVLSTIDSYLHIMGVTAIHDVLQPLVKNRLNSQTEVRYTRYATILLSLVAIGVVLVLHTKNFLGFLVLSLELSGPILMIPLFSSMMGLKANQKDFYPALGVTLLTFVLAKFWWFVDKEHFVALASTVANGIAFFGAHIYRHRGFAIVKSVEVRETVWRPQRAGIVTSLQRWVPTPRRILTYSQNKITLYGSTYIPFGLFCCLNFIFPYFMWGHALQGMHELMLYLRLLGAVLCGLLIVKDKWPKSLLQYLPTFWHLTLLYCLPFTSTVMFLLTQGSTEWLINVALTIMFLIVLVDWMSFLILSALGISLGFLFYKLAIGPINLQLDFSTGYLLVYQGIFATLIGLLFARRKQLNFDTLATQRERLDIDNQATKEDLLEATEKEFRFVRMLKKAGIEQLESVAHLSKRLLELITQKGNTKEVTTLAQQLTDQLTPMALHMDRFAHRTTGFLLLDGVETISLDNFLQALQQALYDKGYKLKIEVRTQHKTIQCDVEKMKKVILNSIAFMHSVAVEGEKEAVLLSITDTQLGYPVDSVSPDHVKKVTALRFSITPASTLPEQEVLYISQMGEESMIQPEAATDLPLFANERIVKAHYGYSGTIGEGNEVTLVYVIPLDVREVRSKDMDTPQMQLGASWSRADDTYPGAQEQEQAFLQAVKKQSHADLSLVAKAIDLIKDYHGPVMRQSGEPFYLHPIAVAQIVMDYSTEEAIILGALLHDTVEDTPLTLEQVALLFNEEVRNIVGGVTHMESNKNTNYKMLLSHPENIHRLLEAEDQRVLYVKLADRMHNLRTIAAKSRESQRRTAEETLLFFVPLAKYLGLMKAAEELKNRSFGVLGK